MLSFPQLQCDLKIAKRKRPGSVRVASSAPFRRRLRLLCLRTGRASVTVLFKINQWYFPAKFAQIHLAAPLLGSNLCAWLQELL